MLTQNYRTKLYKKIKNNISIIEIVIVNIIKVLNEQHLSIILTY